MTSPHTDNLVSDRQPCLEDGREPFVGTRPTVASCSFERKRWSSGLSRRIPARGTTTRYLTPMHQCWRCDELAVGETEVGPGLWRPTCTTHAGRGQRLPLAWIDDAAQCDIAQAEADAFINAGLGDVQGFYRDDGE
jgi:hypothetical protein